MTARKPKDISDVLSAHGAYKKALKQHRSLRFDVADYIASVLPDGTALEWSQGSAYDDHSARFEVGSAIVFPSKQQVWSSDGSRAYGCEVDEPGTEWRDVEHIDEAGGYYMGDGVEGYEKEVPDMSKTQLRALMKLWDNIPNDVLDHAFGDSVVRVYSSGNVTVKEI